MSLDDRIGCTPQLVTACIALAVAIASSVKAGKEDKKQPMQIKPNHEEVLRPDVMQTVFVNSGAER